MGFSFSCLFLDAGSIITPGINGCWDCIGWKFSGAWTARWLAKRFKGKRGICHQMGGWYSVCPSFPHREGALRGDSNDSDRFRAFQASPLPDLRLHNCGAYSFNIRCVPMSLPLTCSSLWNETLPLSVYGRSSALVVGTSVYGLTLLNKVCLRTVVFESSLRTEDSDPAVHGLRFGKVYGHWTGGTLDISRHCGWKIDAFLWA